MKLYLRIVFAFFLLFIFVKCSEGNKENNSTKYYSTSPKDTSAAFTLTNSIADTIPTGKEIPFTGEPSNNLYVDRVNEGTSQKGVNIDYHYEKLTSNKIKYNKAYSNSFQLDSIGRHWVFGETKDTVPHPDVIKTKGEMLTLNYEPRLRLAPLEFKESASLDIQFLSIDQKLSSSTIYDILIDSRGLTWFGTDKGLIRYDGTYSTTYDMKSGLPTNEISCLEEAKNGDLWMGFESGGFAKYDGNDLTVFNKKTCGFNWRVNDIKIDAAGKIWLGTIGAGLCSYDGGEIKSYDRSYRVLSHKDVRSLSFDASGNLWFINFGASIWRKTSQDLRGFNKKSGLNGNWIFSLLNDSKGRIWLGGPDSNFWIIEKDSVKEYRLNTSDKSYITCIREDAEGDIWMGTTLHGLIRVKDGYVERFDKQFGLSSNAVSSIEFDDYGKVWVGTYDGGVSVLNLNSFKYLREFNGLPSSMVNGITEHNDTLFYATREGLAIQYEDTILYVQNYQGPNQQGNLRAHTNQDAVVTPKGLIYTSANNFGYGRYDLKQFNLRRLGGNIGIAQNPSGVAVDLDGIVYGITSEPGGLDFFIGKHAYKLSYRNNYALKGAIDVEVDQNNHLWIGSKNQGLCLFARDYWKYYTTNEGLSDNTIKDVYIESNGRVWVVTKKGVDFVFNDEVHNIDLGVEYNSEVQSILRDHSGTYWFGLSNGLLRLSPLKEANQWDIRNYALTRYSKNDGLVNTSFLQDAMFVSDDNTIYLGTEGGLITKEITNEKNHDYRPNVSLMSIDINRKQIDYSRAGSLEYMSEKGIEDQVNVAKAFYNFPEDLDLSFDNNHLTFHYEGTYHGAESPNRLIYEYYVEGIDEEWIQGPKEQKADYRNIPYGKFTFHLRAYIDGKTPGKEFTYSFRIRPPWYHTWWARVLIVGLILGLVYLIVKARTRTLIKRQKELEDTVDERTSELVQKHQQLEESHREIRDSIIYAKRIQNAILPPRKLVKEYIPQSFILYKPKDVVAGDFYWMTHAEDKILFAAADCTGHGVPGAMVSVICNGSLNRSVKEFNLTDPGQILDKTRELVLEEFEKSEEEVKDGMDIALCSLQGNKLFYAGANNSIWIIRHGTKSIEEIKANKQPIGNYRQPKPFTTHEIDLAKGDTFYIFSDGYVDQFGGEKGKKFKSVNFKQLLLSIQHETMESQRILIDERFESWRAETEQVDDVCVIGVRV